MRQEALVETSKSSRMIDSYWAGYFGLKPEDLWGRKTLIVNHAALEGYDGALAYRRGDVSIVSLPSSTPEIERRKLRQATPEQAFDPEFLARVFVINPDHVSDPAWVGVVDRGAFNRMKGDVRMLDDADEQALVRMADARGEMAWAESALTMDPGPMFGKFKDREIVAVSAYRVMGGLAYIGVVTLPHHRGKGYARQVAGAAMEHAIGRDLVPLWRATEDNPAAIWLAKSLGFRHYASTREIQLIETEF